MHFKKSISILILLMFLSCSGYGQSVNDPESLQKLPFKKLEKLFRDSVQDSINSGIYSTTYLVKAKKALDTLEIANAYDLLCHHNHSNPNVILKYVDSMIQITSNKGFKKYPTRGYLHKGYALFYLKKFDEALDAYLIGLKFAQRKNDIANILAFKHNIALLKNTFGKHREALDMYKENLSFIQTKGKKLKTYRTQLITTIFKLSESFNSLEELDSANHYFVKGLNICSSGKPHRYYPGILLGYSITKFKKGEYQTALDSLRKVEKLASDKEKVYTYLGKTLLKLDKSNEALVYLKKVDSIANDVSYYYPEVRESLKLLCEYYNSVNNTEKQLETLSKIIRLDSISNIKFGELNNNVFKKYDTPLLLVEKEKLIASLERQNSKISTQNIIILVLLGLSFVGIAYYYYRQRLYKTRFTKLLGETTTPDQKEEVVSTANSSGITKETFDHLIDQLQQFEDQKGYLKSNLNAKDLAKSFGSNSSYLSKVINTFKEKSFSAYINDLRIEYVIDKLKTDSIFRKYTIKAIAQDIGFNNAEAFSKAFYKKTGIYPSYFIKELEKQCI